MGSTAWLRQWVSLGDLKMDLPASVRDGYFELAKDCQGTHGMIMEAVAAFARREARALIAAGESKREVADAFELMAAACYEQACSERWMNDYALDLADIVRKAVMSLRAR
jgi:hypothetical protein